MSKKYDELLEVTEAALKKIAQTADDTLSGARFSCFISTQEQSSAIETAEAKRGVAYAILANFKAFRSIYGSFN